MSECHVITYTDRSTYQSATAKRQQNEHSTYYE